MDISERQANQKQAKPQDEIKFIRWPRVHEICGISRSHVHQLMIEGRFPKSIKLCGKRSSGWVLSEVQEWVQQRLASRDQDAA